MNKVEELLINLVRSQINPGAFCENLQSDLTFDTVMNIWNLAAYHSLLPIVAAALTDIQVESVELKSFFMKEIYRAMCESELRNHELSLICDAFNEKKIEHIPLKGAIIKDLYMHSWQRTSCDIDILVHESELDKAVNILEDKLGYRFCKKGTHDIGLLSKNNTYVELHYLLIEENRAQTDILAHVWDYSQKVKSNEWTMAMSDDMFYYYHIAHMANHFKYGGFGIRLLIDLWLLNHKIEFDRTKREDLLKKGLLLDFEKAVNKLSDALFSNNSGDAITERLMAIVIHSGTYGIDSNTLAVKRAGKNKFNYFISRLFMPYSELVKLYPGLNDRKILYPMYTIKRWFRILLYRDHRNVINEIRTNNALSVGSANNLNELVKLLGL